MSASEHTIHSINKYYFVLVGKHIQHNQDRGLDVYIESIYGK